MVKYRCERQSQEDETGATGGLKWNKTQKSQPNIIEDGNGLVCFAWKGANWRMINMKPLMEILQVTMTEKDGGTMAKALRPHDKEQEYNFNL